MPAENELLLIGRRHVRSNNSWLHNSHRLLKGPERCTAMIHPDDATARGLARRCPENRAGSAVTLVRHLPWDQSSIDVEPDDGSGGARPTHVLVGDRATPVGEVATVLGTQAVDGERWLDRAIAVSSDMPGVSRRHCEIAVANGQCVVTDHSRYGTFLNGHRIDGSAVLQAGDVIRVGTPGVEMRMIFVEH